jgi:hypothetical protein
MSPSQFRHQFMVFDTAIDSNSALPLTLEEALDDLSQDGRPFFSEGYRLRRRRSEKSLCLPAAPPSTRKSSFEFFDYASHAKTRGGSVSSDGSAPSMVEDHSGSSDSDADHAAEHDLYEESTGRLWGTYETLLVQNEPSDAIMFHCAYLPGSSDDFQSPLPPFSSDDTLPNKASHAQSHVKSRYSREPKAVQRSFIPVPTRNQPRVKVFPGRCIETFEHQLFNVPDPLPENQTIGLRLSRVQRTARHAPNTLKSLPAIPQKRPGCSPQLSRSKRSRPQPPLRPLPHRQHSAYRDLPYHARPVTNPCNSSHAYSIHNTLPLPAVEKSVFDYDTDDENRHDPVTRLSTSIASKMHIRGLSLGSKIGLNSKKEGCRYEGTRRRRSATEIVLGVFGLGKK